MRWFGRSGSKVTAGTSFALTETGKRKADEYSGGSPKFEVLASLREHGTQSLSELSDETNISIDRLKNVISVLWKQGYIRSMGREEG